ncbi:hypothetical protein TIFTF001_024698 [Ficus carica]|uniref:Uncharacterized protein n=1 Tax=Ficus carica TaxID=3494 RepID=A0AA88DG75_FICCA|nr:hypothetical protein TIFTF001_024698 [Ficus carica]
MIVARDGLDDEGYEAGKEGGGDKSFDGPHENLPADDDAAQIHVLLFLLLLGGTQQPTLLRLVQRSIGQHRPVEVLQVLAPIYPD